MEMPRATSSIVSVRGRKRPAVISAPDRNSLLETRNRAVPQESHYTKEIENNLLRLTTLKVNESNTNIANKVLKDN